MIWLSWRQFRAQAVIGGVVIVVLGGLSLVLGAQIRDSYSEYVGCPQCTVQNAQDAMQGHYGTVLSLLGLLVVVAPGLIGTFWGAPLIARELETHTYRLVWSQSISRLRWLGVRLGFVVVAGAVVAGAISALVGWAARPYDHLVGGRFSPLAFSTHGIVPVGYAVFAVVVGTLAGLLVRRTVAAMALTLVAFTLPQLLVPNYVRPHFQAPVTRTVYATESVLQRIPVLGIGPDGAEVVNYVPAGAWSLTPHLLLRTADGELVSRDRFSACMSGGPDRSRACIANLKLHFTMRYQPADRYWRFQAVETAGYLAVGGVLAGFVVWRIRRRAG